MLLRDPGHPADHVTRVRGLVGSPGAAVARAPGRVNLIGDHTDYNHGLCLPVALPHATYAAAVRRADDRVRISSTSADDRWEGSTDTLGTATGWAAYAAGVLWALREDGVDLPGLEIALDSSVPLGVGLSSSAALGCATALAALALVDLEVPPERVRAACMRAEGEIAGAPTGGMDQTVILHAREGHALLLDFADDSRRVIPLSATRAGLTLLVVDTGVRHELADGGYGDRRRECHDAAARLGVTALHQATTGALAALPDPLRRRARHVLGENRRVEEAVDALMAGDWARLGALLLASHASLRDDFEVSCPELDTVVEAATETGALGARMTGAGFGGSVVALVRTERVAGTASAIDAALTARHGRVASYLLVGDGAAAAALSP